MTQSVSQNLRVRAAPTPGMAEDLLTSDSMAGLNMRPRTTRTSALNGEVLRAFDTYHTELAKAAQVESF